MLISTLLVTLVLVSGGNAALTRTEFNKAITSNGYPKPGDNSIYTYLSKATNKYSRNELAMFLAQLIHESGGFQFREEIACKNTKCPGQYVDKVGLPGKYYYGRGFIQLTWGANYKAASQALGLGDKLLRNPDLVASNTKYAVDVSTWYWQKNVRPALKGANKNKFGVTTKAINGAIECSGGPNKNAARRYQIYLKVADALKIKNKAKENGCYN
uniref:Putative endochitinase 1 n=1 Tax=Melittobia sp. EOM-2016 TaxID=1775962 RepID=A0A0U3T967_9HYME|nr:putative endochitinase 1 [Melittobia sp. EOM-2016]